MDDGGTKSCVSAVSTLNGTQRRNVQQFARTYYPLYTAQMIIHF